MPSNSRVISALQGGTPYTADLNLALEAIDTCHSGVSAPTDDLANGKLWLDTTISGSYRLKMYRGGVWLELFQLTGTTVNMSIGAITGTTLTSSGSVNGATGVFTTSVAAPAHTGSTVNVTTSVTAPSGSFTSISGTTCTYTTVNSTSDERLKSNISMMNSTEALDKVCSLQGVSYIMEGKPNVGLIAQRVEEVVPEVVTTNEDGYKSVAYGNIVALLVEAVKDQQDQINELKYEVNNLKQELERK